MSDANTSKMQKLLDDAKQASVDGAHYAAICALIEAQERDQLKQKLANVPRVETCCECGVGVTDWVEAEYRNGRICRPCEHNLALKQQLADANALLERWSTEQSAFLKGREDAYEQEKKAFEAKLIACEASREKLLSGIALILPLAKGYAHANPVGSNEKYVELATDLLSEEPQTALTEALKPVRNGLSLGNYILDTYDFKRPRNRAGFES